MYFRFRSSKLRLMAALLFLPIGLPACLNVYRDFGDRSSDEFLIAQARIYMDEYDFDNALSAITPVLQSQPDNEDVVYLASAAHAGRAGLRILDLFAVIGSESGTKGLIQIFAEHFSTDDIPADDDTVADIEAAIEILNDYNSDPTARSSRLNFYMTFLWFSRVGVIAARYGMTGASLNLQFSPCKESVNASGATGIPSAKIDDIIEAFGEIPNAISNSGSDAFSSISSSFVLPAPSATCEVTPGSAECLFARSLLGIGPPTTSSGIGFDIFNPVPACSLGVVP